MSLTTAQWLIGLGMGVFLTLIAGVVKIGIAFGDIAARVKALEEDTVEDTCAARIGELHERIDAHDVHLAQIDTRCDERSPVEKTGRHILEAR